jgi:beta-lactamase class C
VPNGELTIVDKNGGLDNTSTYVGFIPQERIGIAILVTRGGVPATRIVRRIMLALARGNAAGPGDDRAARG